jgi:DNA-binding GntR family transcriptional regulator
MIIDNKLLSLEERVYLELEDEILSGALPKGTALGEVALSERLGVSRTPVRSALHRLNEDGLVESVANRGSVVVGVTGEDIIDIYKIRIRLEGLASSVAAERISREGLEKLSESVELSEFYIRKKDTERLRELDSEFHETIYREAGNRLLCKTLSELHKRIKLYRKLSLTVPGRLEKSVLEHREIFEAIKRADAAEADRLTSLHIERAMNNVILALEKEGMS